MWGGRRQQHPLLFLLGWRPCLSPSGRWFLSDASRAPEPNIYTCLKLWLFFTLFLKYQWQLSLLYTALLTLHPCHLPMLAFSTDMFFHSYCTHLLSFCSFFIPISLRFLIPLLISPFPPSIISILMSPS